MKTLYAGIDVSKDKFDVSYTTDGECSFEHSTYPNNLKGFKTFLKKSEKIMQKEECKDIHFCMEATGIYHCELCEYLQNSAHLVSVVNPLMTKSFAKSLLLRTKNDKVDSKMLSQYAYKHKPAITPKLPTVIKKFRSLVRYKDSLTVDRTREIARLKSSLDSDVKKLINNNIAFIEKQIKDVISKITDLVKQDEFLTKQVNLLKTVPCVSDAVAWKLLSEIKCDSIENLSPKSQVANAGLSPKENDSGNKATGRGCISRMGNSDIRKMLFMPALGCIKNENYFTEFYKHLINKGKPKKVAIVAVMRKILLTSMGVLKNQQQFDSNWAKKIQTEHLNKLAA